nr:hypothetical protein [Tanacetum cinerariifolium]GEZ89401.1 hypothetical protein [Tanacetum cinerariifolium]
MSKSSQTLRMLTNEQSLYRDNKRKIGLRYMDPYPLGQAIACHPKLYDAEVLGLHYVKPDVHDTKEILNDVEESQVKMKEKQFHLNYETNLYDTFVPQIDLSPKQEYFLDPSISFESESSKEMSDLPISKMPKKTLSKQTKENFDLLMKIDNLENAFANEVKRKTMGKLTAFKKENCDFGSKVTHLKKIIAQKSKDFNDVKLELWNRIAKFEAYFEKLKSTKVVLKRQLTRRVDDSKAKNDQFFKEINHLRTQLENLKGKSVKTKFDKPSNLGNYLLINF